MKKRLRRIIKNQIPGRAVVQKFSRGDMRTPLQEVTYAMSSLPALTYFYMQFILGDFAWERYPRYIEGTLKSSKVKDVFYYDKLEDYVIRSSPYTAGEKWKFRTRKKEKAVLPERKKRLVLKKVEVECNADTSKKDDRSSGTVLEIKHFLKRRTEENVGGNKGEVHLLRTGLHRGRKAEVQRTGKPSLKREQEVKVAVECCRRPQLRKR